MFWHMFTVQDTGGDDVGNNSRSMPQQDADTVLALRAAGGDAAAFEKLVTNYEKFVYHTAYYVTGNREDAYDLSQEIFIKMWHGLTAFRGDAKFLTWMTQVAKNASADWIRKKQRRIQTQSLDSGDDAEAPDSGTDPPDQSGDHDPQTQTERKENAALVQTALNNLSEEHRTIVQLRDVEGYSYEKIAALLGLETGTVKSRLFRARAQLRNFLESHNFFG